MQNSVIPLGQSQMHCGDAGAILRWPMRTFFVAEKKKQLCSINLDFCHAHSGLCSFAIFSSSGIIFRARPRMNFEKFKSFSMATITISELIEEHNLHDLFVKNLDGLPKEPADVTSIERMNRKQKKKKKRKKCEPKIEN